MNDISEYERLSDPARWESDVEKRIDELRAKRLGRPTMLLGSSSFVMWENIESELGLVDAVNLSFGGSTVFDLLFYLDRLVLGFSPSHLIICSGDNDLARGRCPLMVAADYMLLAKYLWAVHSDTRIAFISVKPSIARFGLKREQDDLNARLADYCRTDQRLAFLDVVQSMVQGASSPAEELFLEDGLHLSEIGYRIWKEALVPQLAVFELRRRV